MTLDELKAKVGGDSFALLGLPHRFEMDASLLKKSYLALSRLTHPDFFTGDAEGAGEALALSAAVNDAHRTLLDPVKRAEYVLLVHGGKDAGQDKRVPPEMLGEMLMLNEEIMEAKTSGDAGTLARIGREMQQRHAELLSEISSLAAALTASGDARTPGDVQTLDALRLALNAMKYVQNILAQVG